MIVLAIVAIFVVWGLATIATSSESITSQSVSLEGAEAAAELYRGLPQRGDELGDLEAGVQIDVFNDVQCRPCASWHLRTVPSLVRTRVRNGDVRLVFQHFVTSERETTVGAIAAIAAGRLDAEWQFSDLLLRNLAQVPPSGIDESFLRKVAVGAGLSGDRWAEQRDDPTVLPRLEQAERLAAAESLPAQPAVIVTGPSGARTLERSPDLRSIERAIDDVG